MLYLKIEFMKILQVITLAECGGAQMHLLELLEGLKPEFEFLVLLGSEGFLSEKLKELKIPFEICPNLIRKISPLHDLKALFEIIKVIQKYQPNLIHCHSSKAGILGRMAAFFCQIPSIFTAHGWAFHPEISFLARNMALISEVFCSWLCQKIICVSQFDHQLALETKFIARNKLITIRNGIQNKPINKISKQKNQIDILMISRFAKPKRPDLLITAFKNILPKTNKQIGLLLAGDGPERAKNEALVEKYKLQNNIKFLGEVVPADKVLQSADIFALISDREGLPISLLEAMRAELPLIASDVGGIKEIIQENTNGYLIHSLAKLEEKLLDLIEDENKRKIFGQNSRKYFLEQFKAEIMLKKIKNIYYEFSNNNECSTKTILS